MSSFSPKNTPPTITIRLASSAPVHPVIDAYFNRNSQTGEHDSQDDSHTIVGFGSLMSIRSSTNTFPDLKNFRTVRLHGYRRVFRHSPSFFFERGIAEPAKNMLSSLSVEKASGFSFLAVAFSVYGMNSHDFYERENEYDFDIATFEEISTSSDNIDNANIESNARKGEGILCLASSDATYISRHGEEKFRSNYIDRGLPALWDWSMDSDLKPCSVYLRHCYLAAASNGAHVLQSFLDDTFLVDRVTTVREYLDLHPEVLNTEPPESVRGRYDG